MTNWKKICAANMKIYIPVNVATILVLFVKTPFMFKKRYRDIQFTIHTYTYTQEQIENWSQRYQDFVKTENEKGRTYGLKQKFANKYFHRDKQLLNKMIKLAESKGSDTYKYEKVQNLVYEKFKEAQSKKLQVTWIDLKLWLGEAVALYEPKKKLDSDSFLYNMKKRFHISSRRITK